MVAEITYVNGQRRVNEAKPLNEPFALVRKIATTRGKAQRLILDNGIRVTIAPTKKEG